MIAKTPLDAWIHRKIGGSERGAGPTWKDIRIYQLERLKETIEFARLRSPFYGIHLARFSHGAIFDHRDIEVIPFTTADHIRVNPWRFLAVSQDD